MFFLKKAVFVNIIFALIRIVLRERLAWRVLLNMWKFKAEQQKTIANDELERLGVKGRNWPKI